MAMFQGTVLDAETIYLGSKIEQGFKTVAAAMANQTVHSQLAAIRETIGAIDPRSSLRSIRDRSELDAGMMRKEIAALTAALVPVPPRPVEVPISEGETPA